MVRGHYLRALQPIASRDLTRVAFEAAMSQLVCVPRALLHFNLAPPTGHVVQLGAQPKEASPGGRGAPLGDATKATAEPEVLHPYASGSGLGNRTLDLLAEARSRGAAVGAFTVFSLEGIRAVVQAAEATGRSAILQVR